VCVCTRVCLCHVLVAEAGMTCALPSSMWCREGRQPETQAVCLCQRPLLLGPCTCVVPM
jgi:hypothetical protein